MTMPPLPRQGHNPQQAQRAVPPPPPPAYSATAYAPPPMLDPLPSHAAPKRDFLTPYTAVWSVLGLIAAGYIGVLVFSPQLIENMGPATAQALDPTTARGAARLSADVTALKDSIARVQLDLSKVKTDIAGQTAREKLLTAQITQLERRLGAGGGAPVNAGDSPATTIEDPAATQEEARAATPADKPAGAKDTQGSPQQPKLVNGEGSLDLSQVGLETGSVPVPAAAAPAAKTAKTAAKTVAAEPGDFSTVVKPDAKPLGVQISSGASIDSLRLSWSLLADRHGDTLKNMEARYVARGDASNPTFDLIAGPIKSKSEAQRVCKALAAKNVPCKVGDFAGESL